MSNTIQTDTHQNGCHNRARFLDTVTVQTGWTPDGRREMKSIPAFGKRDCQYDRKQIDQGCKGCSWLKTPNPL